MFRILKKKSKLHNKVVGTNRNEHHRSTISVGSLKKKREKGEKICCYSQCESGTKSIMSYILVFLTLSGETASILLAKQKHFDVWRVMFVDKVSHGS